MYFSMSVFGMVCQPGDHMFMSNFTVSLQAVVPLADIHRSQSIARSSRTPEHKHNPEKPVVCRRSTSYIHYRNIISHRCVYQVGLQGDSHHIYTGPRLNSVICFPFYLFMFTYMFEFMFNNAT